MDIGFIAVIAIFVVLIIVVIVRRDDASNDDFPKEPLSSREQARRGRPRTAHLVAAGPRDLATFRVEYRNGTVANETVNTQSSRYEQMRAAEPKRLHLDGGWGNDITIVYQDGERVKCRCVWTSWEASQLRDALLKQGREGS